MLIPLLVFPSDPCFEAVILRALGKYPVGNAKDDQAHVFAFVCIIA
jgi:hypothetical protein